MKTFKLDNRVEGWGWVFVEVESEKWKIIECVWIELASEQLFTGDGGTRASHLLRCQLDNSQEDVH